MLLRFSLKNYKSFKETATLDMMSSSKIRQLLTHRINLHQVNVLKNSAIYGANASGKSNLIKAFSMMKRVVMQGDVPDSASQSYCKLTEDGKKEESTFNIQLELNGKFYDYGFSVIFDELQITNEWLYSLRLRGEESQLIYEVRNGSVSFGEDLDLAEDDSNRLQIYIDDFLESNTDLFLCEMGKGKRMSEKSIFGVFSDIYRWFKNDLTIIGPEQLNAKLYRYFGEDSIKILQELLYSFDTGITDLKEEKITIDEVGQRVNKMAAEVIEDVLNEWDEESGGVIIRSNDVFIRIEKNNDSDTPEITLIKICHHNSFFEYDFWEESDGTRRLFDFIDMILTKNENSVYVVDEIDRSLHPYATKHLIEMFNEFHKSDKAQLVFTTHEDAIMSTDILRRDEIWFVDRKSTGQSILYSLDSFDVRSDSVFSKSYLEGRYGGVPTLKQYSFEGESTEEV